MLKTPLWLLGPLVLLGAAALYLSANWDRIPPRFPVHWGVDGKPNGWSTRTAAGVYGPLWLGAGIVLFIAAIVAVIAGSRRGRARPPAATIVPIAVAWVIGVAFSIVGLLPLHTPPIWAGWVMVAGFLAVIAVAIGWSVRSSARASTADACWRGGQFYYNPDDPALFVPKRSGLGLTLNFANRWSWLVLAVMVLVPVGLVVFALAITKG